MADVKYTPRLRTFYEEKIVPQLMEEFSYKSIMEVPKLTKICVNQGIGDATQDKKLVDIAVKEMTSITGQKVVSVMSKKSVSNFKLREDMPIAARVTMRSTNMYDFLDRLIAVALPRVRDFRGVSDKAFDGRGNYTLGITEQIIFPEINLDQVNKISGMDITFVTTANTDAEAFALLKAFGMPFKNQNKEEN